MHQPRAAARLTDATAVTLSGLCLVHCLLLPLLVVLLPALAPLAELAWLHWLFVGLAVPVAALMIADCLPLPAQRGIALQGLLGIGLLLGALLVPPLAAHEQVVSILGALLLAGAHLRRWFLRRRVPRELGGRC